MSSRPRPEGRMSLLIEKHTCNSSNTISSNPDEEPAFSSSPWGAACERKMRGIRACHHLGTLLTSIEPCGSGVQGPSVLVEYWAPAHLYTPTTTAWSLSYGSRVNCSWGFMFSCCIFFTSEANTASADAVESMQLAYGGERI